MTRITRLIMAFTLFVTAPALAHETMFRHEHPGPEIEDFAIFHLWNSCNPVGLIVNEIDEEGVAIGLTTDTIETTVRSRLRSARLYEEREVGLLNLYPFSFVYADVQVFRGYLACLSG